MERATEQQVTAAASRQAVQARGLEKAAGRARAALWSVPVGLQLSALYTLLLAVTLALLGWALYTQLERFLVQNTAERLEHAAETVIARGIYGGERGRRFIPPDATITSYLDRALAPMVRELSAPDVTVAVMDEAGGVITSTLTYEGGEPRLLPAMPDGWTTEVGESGGEQLAQWVVADPAGGRLLVVAQPLYVRSPGTPDMRLLLMQAASLDAADDTLDQVRLFVLLGLLIGTAVGVLAGLALTRAVLKPLDRMARTSEAIAGGDLNRRLRLPAGRNEIARLGSAFDHMVDRLAATLHAQRRFVADASHELRTPLTSLEGLSEILLLGADRGDSGAVQRTVRSMHSELGRMGRLVSDLLTLSRLDSSAPMSFGTVDAARLLDDVAVQMAPLAETRQVTLHVEHDGPMPVRADPDRLKQVVLNLVDNAVRYTPPEGTVTLSVSALPAGSTVQIQVRDTGQGIASEDLPHIFDRFYRGDPSRARATGNTGLGLAIVRAIVEAHGGTIEVQSSPGAGSCFTVSLPAAEKPARSPLPAGR